MMKNRLLVVDRTQYGYQTGSYKYVQYLKDKYDITYICFDQNKSHYEEEGVEIIYISRSSSFWKRIYTFISHVLDIIKRDSHDIILIRYFFLSSLIPFLSKKRSVLNIRTGSVGFNPFKNLLLDKIMLFESRFFDRVLVISASLAKKLSFNSYKVDILPLGSDILSFKSKDYSKLHLFYMGSLALRGIDQTIEGIYIFLQKNRDIEIKYDIIGRGGAVDVASIESAIKRFKLEEYVFFHGEKRHSELGDYFDSSTVGVSYIPMTSYFDCQPPTKTFEYLGAGMVCLATRTAENIAVINEKNGQLCDDNPESFADALKEIYLKRDGYRTSAIQASLKEYQWRDIVNDRLYPALEMVRDGVSS